MNKNETTFSRIVILSGSPGTGKSTIAQMLAEESVYDKAVHIEVDDFWQSIRKGYIHPWMDGSGDQNQTVAEAVAAGARVYSQGGYEVFAAGTIGPWFLEPWMDIAKAGADVRYIVLRPDEETTVMRATTRQQREFFPLDVGAIRDVWKSFTNMGRYESFVLDTTGQSIEESVTLIKRSLSENRFRL